MGDALTCRKLLFGDMDFAQQVELFDESVVLPGLDHDRSPHSLFRQNERFPGGADLLDQLLCIGLELG